MCRIFFSKDMLFFSNICFNKLQVTFLKESIASSLPGITPGLQYSLWEKKIWSRLRPEKILPIGLSPHAWSYVFETSVQRKEVPA